MKELISIIIPTYKGSQTIIHLIQDLMSALKEYNYEMVIVNDNSPDDSHVKLINFQFKYKEIITYIKLSKNFGEYNAVMAGLRNCNGDYAIIIDDDFQHSPDQVVKLVEHCLKSNNDVIYTKYKQKKHSLLRNVMSSISNLTAKYIFKIPGKIYLSSFKAIKRNIIEIITKYKGNYAFIDGLIFSCTDKIETFEVEHNKRLIGRSTYNIFKLGNHYLNLLTNFSILPLRLFFLFGLIIAIISFVFILFIVIEKILNPNIPVGYSSLVASIVLFSGIQILFLGFIGEYIGKILKLVNKDHQYIIEYISYKQNSQK